MTPVGTVRVNDKVLVPLLKACNINLSPVDDLKVEVNKFVLLVILLPILLYPFPLRVEKCLNV